MGRGLAGRPPVCAEHPHRPAVDRCDECRRPFCAECFLRGGRRLLCRACRQALLVQEAEATRRRRLSARLRRLWHAWRVPLVAGVGVAALAGGTLALSATGGGRPGAAISPALADDPAVLQRVAAERYCAVGRGTTGEVPAAGGGAVSRSQGAPRSGAAANPVLTAPTGALVAAVASFLPDTLLHDDRLAGTPIAYSLFDPMNLIPYRGGWVAPLPGWRSQTGLLPQQVGFELLGTVVVERVAFQQAAMLPRESWAKDVGLLLSTEGPDTGFYQVGRWTLAQATSPQEFWFFETPARYARVCLYSNYGSREFISLGAFVLGITPPPSLIDTQGQPLLPRGR